MSWYWVYLRKEVICFMDKRAFFLGDSYEEIKTNSPIIVAALPLQYLWKKYVKVKKNSKIVWQFYTNYLVRSKHDDQ